MPQRQAVDEVILAFDETRRTLTSCHLSTPRSLSQCVMIAIVGPPLLSRHLSIGQAGQTRGRLHFWGPILATVRVVFWDPLLASATDLRNPTAMPLGPSREVMDYDCQRCHGSCSLTMAATYRGCWRAWGVRFTEQSRREARCELYSPLPGKKLPVRLFAISDDNAGPKQLERWTTAG